MKSSFKKLNILLLLFLILSSFLAAQEKENNEETKTPQEEIVTQAVEPLKIDYSTVFKDARRFEIISFGAMPFITMDVTLGYSFYKFFTNDFDSSYFNLFSSKNYTTSEIKGILYTSMGISVGIAITDLIVNLVKRNKVKKQNLQQTIEIYPYDTTKIQTEKTEEKVENQKEGS